MSKFLLSLLLMAIPMVSAAGTSRYGNYNPYPDCGVKNRPACPTPKPVDPTPPKWVKQKQDSGQASDLLQKQLERR